MSAPAHQPAHARLRRHVVYAVVITAVVLLSGYPSILPVFRDKLQRYLSIDDQTFGFLFSVNMVGSVVTVLIGGALVDRWGPRRIIHLSILGAGAGMVLIGLAGQRWGLFAAALGIGGLFSGPLNIAMSAYLARLFPRHRRRVLSLNLAAISAGTFVFPALAEGWLYLARVVPSISLSYVLHLPFLAVAAMLLASSLWYRGSAPHPRGTVSRGSWEWRGLILPPRVLLLTALMALHGGVDSTIYIWLARFLGSASFNSQPFAPGFVLSGFSLAYLVSRSLLASIPETHGQRAFLILPGLLGGGVFIAGILSRQYWLSAGAYVLGGFLWSSEYPTMLSMLARDRKSFGVAQALSQVLGGLLTFLLLNGVGLIASRVGEAEMWRAMLAIACGFPLVGIGGAIWWALFGKTNEEQEPCP